MQGFRAAQIPAFPVGVNQTVTQDVRLAVGSMAEKVTVTAEAEMIQQTSAELGSVIQERAVANLPLNGRNFTQLLVDWLRAPVPSRPPRRPALDLGTIPRPVFRAGLSWFTPP